MTKFIVAFALICSSILYSQNKLTGQVVNSKNQPLEFIDVLLINKDSITIKNGLTDLNGHFKIILDSGDYLLRLRQFNTVLWEKKIKIDQDFDLGNIKLKEKEQKLKEVVVSGKKKIIERKVDRLVFNVENSVVMSSGDALDVLKATPSLLTQENSISIIGKSTVSVMVDDRIIQLSGEDLSNFLKSIPSESISKIEIITAPPAKYEAQGNSGLINIVLKKNKKNFFNGNIKTSYTQAKYDTENIGGALNYQKNNLSVTSNLDFTNGITAPIQKYNYFYPQYTWKENYNVKNSRDNGTARIALDYKMTNATTIGIEYNGILNNSDIKSKNQAGIYNNTSNALDSTIVTSSIKSIERKTNSVNFHTITKLDTIGKKVSFDIDYFQYGNAMNNNFNTRTLLENGNIKPSSLFSALNDGEQTIKIYSSKVDIYLPLKWANLSMGGKLSFTKNDNKTLFYDIALEQFIFDPQKSSHFLYEENNNAVYLSVNKDLSKEWSVQLGLRLENTLTKSTLLSELNNTYKNNYTELFPSFYLTYNTDSEATLSFTYTRRIDRPSYNLLNPFRIYSTSTNYTEGNPYLNPYFSNNFEVSYMKGDFYHSLFFNYINNGIDQVTFTNDNQDYQYTTPYNFITIKEIGLSENYTFSKVKGWVSNNGLTLFYNNNKSSLQNIPNDIEGLTVYFSSNNDFTLNTSKTFKAELNFTYQSNSVTNSYKTTSYYRFDTGIKKDFFNKKCQFGIAVTDIFRTSAIKFSNNVNGIYQEKYDYPDTQKIRFSLIYKFGKSIKEDNRQFSNAEEQKRTR